MNWYQWLSVGALAVCLTSILFHVIRLIRKGNPSDYAKAAGSTARGIRYSFTGAMSPKKKESAYLHLPTYTAGLLYHAGTFLAILLFLLNLLNLLNLPNLLYLIIILFLTLSSISGLAILIKRISKSLLRRLSNADDYISNILVTGFQIITLIMIIIRAYSGNPSLNDSIEMTYYLMASLLLLYLPLGKLKHLVYFFAARYHLGWFYGRRGVWG